MGCFRSDSMVGITVISPGEWGWQAPGFQATPRGIKPPRRTGPRSIVDGKSARRRPGFYAGYLANPRQPFESATCRRRPRRESNIRKRANAGGGPAPQWDGLGGTKGPHGNLEPVTESGIGFADLRTAHKRRCGLARRET